MNHTDQHIILCYLKDPSSKCPRTGYVIASLTVLALGCHHCEQSEWATENRNFISGRKFKTLWMWAPGPTPTMLSFFNLTSPHMVECKCNIKIVDCKCKWYDPKLHLGRPSKCPSLRYKSMPLQDIFLCLSVWCTGTGSYFWATLYYRFHGLKLYR